MRIEIISGGETSVYTMPEKADFLGVTIENQTRVLNIIAGIPNGFGNLLAEYTNQEYRLSEELKLTIHLYTLDGEAQAFSWKPYQNFLFYDLCFDGFHIKVYG